MNFDEYQKESRKTALYNEKRFKVYYPVLGLVGETGEVAGKIKKIIRDDNGNISEAKRLELAKELGDVLWYLSQIVTDLGFSFNEIAEINIKKIFSRKKRGKIKGSGDNR